MKSKSLMLSLVVMAIVHPLWSQVTIKSRIADENGNPLAYASIIAFHAADSTFLQGDISKDDGTFIISIDSKEAFILRISAIGYNDFNITVYPGIPDMVPELIRLKPSANLLNEIVVTSRKPLFEQKIDRMVVNVEGSIMSKGNSLLSVLSRSPSVRINQSSGEISLLGKQGVLIMVDDKPVRLERQDLVSYLSSLSADNIATIELITAPPAGYDAQGTAGIINITTTKKKNGLMGQISPTFGIGKRPKFGNAFTISYQKGKLYAYAIINTSLNYDHERINVRIQSETLGRASLLDIERKPQTGLYTGDIGFDYQLNAKNTIGVMVSLLKSDWKMHSNAVSAVSEGSVNSRFSTRSYEENYLFRTLYNLNFRHKFNKNFHLNLDADHIDFTRENPTLYTVSQEGGIISGRFRSEAVTPVKVTVLKADASVILPVKSSLDFGIKTSLSSFTNNVNVANEVNNEWKDDHAFKNRFDLSENIMAGYVNLNWKPGPKITSKIGVRYEYYDLDLLSQTHGKIVNRNVGNWFPSLFLSYEPGKHQHLNFSFVNRIQRPGFLILAPYFYFLDHHTLTTGNPTILPSGTSQLQLSYSLSQFSFTIQHNIESTPILDFQPTINKDIGIFEIKPFQGILNRNLTFTINAPFDINKWWSIRLNPVFYLNNQRFRLNNDLYDRKIFSFEATAHQTFKITKSLDAELTSGYYAANIYGTLDVIRRSQVDVGIRKKFRSDVALVLSVNDIFNTGTQWPTESRLLKSDLNYYFNFDAEGPVFRVTLNIPFGKKPEEKEKRSGGATEELNRIK